jgi:hypothetical protein
MRIIVERITLRGQLKAFFQSGHVDVSHWPTPRKRRPKLEDNPVGTGATGSAACVV